MSHLQVYPDEYDSFIRSAIAYKRYCFEMIFNTSANEAENLFYFYQVVSVLSLGTKATGDPRMSEDSVRLVQGSSMCQYSTIENKLAVISKNQRVLEAKLNQILALLQGENK